MKFCPYCGAENPMDYNFCNNCHKQLPVEKQNDMANVQAVKPEPNVQVNVTHLEQAPPASPAPGYYPPSNQSSEIQIIDDVVEEQTVSSDQISNGGQPSVVENKSWNGYHYVGAFLMVLSPILLIYGTSLAQQTATSFVNIWNGYFFVPIPTTYYPYESEGTFLAILGFCLFIVGIISIGMGYAVSSDSEGKKVKK